MLYCDHVFISTSVREAENKPKYLYVLFGLYNSWRDKKVPKKQKKISLRGVDFMYQCQGLIIQLYLSKKNFLSINLQSNFHRLSKNVVTDSPI